MSVYKIQAGDNLIEIAKRFGVEVTALLAINPQIQSPHIIFEGQPINIPHISPTPEPEAVAGHSEIPPWLAIARNEIGVTELSGRRHNPRIVEYHASTTLRAGDDETAWCSSFVNWCVTKAGLVGTNSAAAKSWLNWKGGLLVRTVPKPGDIVVLHRGSNPWQGHVAFFERANRNGFYLLGGNQSNKVQKSFYRAEKLAGIVRPIVNRT